MSQGFNVPVVLGTAREGRQSEKAAKLVLGMVQERGWKTQLVDVRDILVSPMTVPSWEEAPASENWRKVVEESDGLVIVSPEYNHGYPGELKMLLDQAYKEYVHKPVGLCGVSSGLMGGVRAVESLRLVCMELGLVPMQLAVYFRSIKDTVNEEGKTEDEKLVDAINNMLDDLEEYAEAFATSRPG